MANDKDKREVDSVSGVETTGHEWDGLKELNNPAPNWWLRLFYVCVVFAIGYWVVYPAWPTLTGFTGGSKGWSEYTQLKEHQGEITAMRTQYEGRFAAADLQTIQNDPELYNYARAGGAIAFKNNCAACHGSGGQGGYGFPNLNADRWLWGGTLEQIYTTIRYGARSTSDQTHMSQMPAFGRDNLLSHEEIEQVAEYVQNIHLGDKAEKTPAYLKGKEIFANNCTSCHGDNGEGKIEVGAPRLNTEVWLYGGDRASIINSITNPHAGVMPTWEGRLSDSTIKQLAIYVHSLGGGK